MNTHLLETSMVETSFTNTAGTEGPALVTRILVPTDFSLPSERAVDYAVSLAERSSGASIDLINVVEPFPAWQMDGLVPMAPTEDEEARRCGKRLSVLAAGRSTPRCRISTSEQLGQPVEEIIKEAERMGADLVVLGTSGRSGLKHLLLGSVAEKVVREAPCPVLVVREKQHQFVGSHRCGPAPWGLRKILVPTDFSHYSAEALQYAVRFAQQFGGKITLVHTVSFTGEVEFTERNDLIATMRDTAEGRLAEFGQAYLPASVGDGRCVLIGPPESELAEYAKTGDFDLIVCATHGYTGLKHVLLGSTAESILRHAPCPVLIVRHGVTAAHEPSTN